MDHSTVSSKACWMVIKGTTWPGVAAYIAGGSAKGFAADISALNSGPGGYDGTNVRLANASNKVATGAIHSILTIATKVYIDGVEVSGYSYSDTLGTVDVVRLATRTDINYPVAMDLVEIAHFNGTPSAGDITALKAWAQTTYGTP
jgi:hypothetical protein